jgi:regulator of sigma E protease
VDTLTTLISAAILLGVLVFVHELGHFILAKKAGVGVTTFSLGFGPRLFGFKKGETDYRISLIPLGGFVRMIGENPGEEVDPADKDRAFSEKSVGWRLAIVGAGPLSNIALALVLYYIVLLFWGIPTLTTLVGGVKPGSPAALAEIQKGDRVLAINNKPMHKWDDMVEIIQGSDGKPVQVAVKRGKEVVTSELKPKMVEVTDIFGDTHRIFQVGMMSGGDIMTIDVGPFEAIGMSFQRAYLAAEIIAKSVYKIITQQVSADNIGGPILIAQAAGEAVKHGMAPYLNLAGLISVNLAILNLLPIPALDGGHLFFFLIEAVRRKPVSIKWREKAQQMGMALLLMLMAFIFYNDIARLVTG